MSDSGDNREQLTDGPGSKQPARRSTRSTHAKRGGNSSGYPPGSRHQARILALQVLYEIDVTDHNLVEVLARSTEDPEESVTPAVRSHVDRLVRGSLSQRDNIDKYISEAAPAFPVTQLPAVDRNVLRLAIYELLCEPEVPPKAAINEAVELAKRFGGMNSSRFVNGVLGTVTHRLNPKSPGPNAESSEAESSTP